MVRFILEQLMMLLAHTQVLWQSRGLAIHCALTLTVGNNKARGSTVMKLLLVNPALVA